MCYWIGASRLLKSTRGVSLFGLAIYIQKASQVMKPPPVARSILNKTRGGPPERRQGKKNYYRNSNISPFKKYNLQKLL
jgi:hypothetical protein